MAGVFVAGRLSERPAVRLGVRRFDVGVRVAPIRCRDRSRTGCSSRCQRTHPSSWDVPGTDLITQSSATRALGSSGIIPLTMLVFLRAWSLAAALAPLAAAVGGSRRFDRDAKNGHSARERLQILAPSSSTSSTSTIHRDMPITFRNVAYNNIKRKNE